MRENYAIKFVYLSQGPGVAVTFVDAIDARITGEPGVFYLLIGAKCISNVLPDICIYQKVFNDAISCCWRRWTR